MDLTRRSLITGIAALLAMPAVVRAASLMPIQAIPEVILAQSWILEWTPDGRAEWRPGGHDDRRPGVRYSVVSSADGRAMIERPDSVIVPVKAPVIWDDVTAGDPIDPDSIERRLVERRLVVPSRYIRSTLIDLSRGGPANGRT